MSEAPRPPEQLSPNRLALAGASSSELEAAEVPADRWDVDAVRRRSRRARQDVHARCGGFLDDVDRFDPQFFGISPREAETMDPQQRLLLEVAWEALEHAGIAPTARGHRDTGVFVGIGNSDYARAARCRRPPGASTRTRHRQRASSVAAGRLSYVARPAGPERRGRHRLLVVAGRVHLACAGPAHGRVRPGAGRRRQPDAVARRRSSSFSQARVLAPDGRCKTFDAGADGYVRGEGCGVVVLKRCRDALADGDRVLAVIRGSAVNQDGRSNGLTAPNGRRRRR